MKVNELRVGNYILFKLFGKGAGKIGAMKKGDFGRFNNEEYHPIPLTPEWITQCGIPKNDYGSWPIGEQFVLKQNGLIDEIGNIDGYILIGLGYHGLVTKPNIKYVHEFQNLYFALTGEELKIEL